MRYGFGFRFIACGPILQKEMSGWDTNYLVGQALYPHLYNDKAPAPVREGAWSNKGHLGMKTKHGFWEWNDEIDRQGKSAHRALPAGGDGNTEIRRREVTEWWPGPDEPWLRVWPGSSVTGKGNGGRGRN